MDQVTEESRIANQFRGDRRPLPARTAARSSGSAFGTCILSSPSRTSPAVSQGSGNSRKMTSEKLSPGALSFLSLLCASVLIVKVTNAIH